MAKIKIKDLEPISATRAKVVLGEVIHQTAVEGKRFLISRNGKPVSVILSYNEYLGLIRDSTEVNETELLNQGVAISTLDIENQNERIVS